jgi:DNA-binding NarL/FixJ family response regulator
VSGDLSTVVIADGDAEARTLVSDLLASAGIPSVEAPTGDDALAAVRKTRPALVIADVGVPGLSGYEVCSRLKAEFGDGLPVILVSGSRTEPCDCTAGLLIGADDYVTKPFDGGELLARARRCIVRASLIEQSSNDPRENPFGLSPREVEVLTLLAEGLGTAGIAERLFISRQTVATHVQRILAKLGAHSRAEAVAIAYRAQLVEGVEAHMMVRAK